jgi:dipeptidyl-peptidase-3
MKIECNPGKNKLTVLVDRSRIIEHGKPALGRMLLNLHIYRCTADIDACRAFYEDLSKVDGEFAEWRRIVLANKEPKWVFSQPNTFESGEDHSVSLKEYPATPRGVIESWAERDV